MYSGRLIRAVGLYRREYWLEPCLRQLLCYRVGTLSKSFVHNWSAAIPLQLRCQGVCTSEFSAKLVLHKVNTFTIKHYI